MEIINIALEAGVSTPRIPGDARPALTVSMFTSSMEESIEVMNRIRAMEAQVNAKGAKDSKQTEIPGTEADTPDKPEGDAPKRGRGRPAMSDEEKAAKKAEREAKKQEAADAIAQAEAEAAAEVEAAKKKAAKKAAKAKAAEAEADEDDDDDDVVVEDDEDADSEDDEPEAAEDSDEDEDEDEDEEPEGIKAVVAKVQGLSKLRDVLTALQEAGYKTANDLVAVCEDIQADVPALARIKGLPARVARAASVMGID